MPGLTFARGLGERKDCKCTRGTLLDWLHPVNIYDQSLWSVRVARVARLARGGTGRARPYNMDIIDEDRLLMWTWSVEVAYSPAFHFEPSW
jgi:hypothetical protein